MGWNDDEGYGGTVVSFPSRVLVGCIRQRDREQERLIHTRPFPIRASYRKRGDEWCSDENGMPMGWEIEMWMFMRTAEPRRCQTARCTTQ